jgi:uncharacterized metal-binding protein YceD (DUF177 family)
LTQISKDRVFLKGSLSGNVEVICSSCGEDIDYKIDEKLDLTISDGIYNEDDNLLDVVEFFEGFVDIDEIIEGEVASIRSDFHYCKNCK